MSLTSKLNNRQVVVIGDQDGNNFLNIDTSRGLPVFSSGLTTVVNGSITRPADTSQYTIGDAITNSTSAPSALSFTNVVPSNGMSGIITSAVLVDSANQSTKGEFDLFLFDTAYTPNNDNTGLAISDAELETCVGVIRFFSSNFIAANGSSGAAGNAICHGTILNSIPFKCGASSTSLFGALVARNAYTPVSAEKFTIRLSIVQD